MLIKSIALLLLAGLLAHPARAAGNPQAEGLQERLVETQTRPGVYQRSLLSRRGNGGEQWLLVSFPGYPGILRLRESEGEIDYDLRGNFLVRARRHLVTPEIAVATLDCPSDEFTACKDVYRSSERHVSDVLAQIDALKTIVGSQVKIALIGTSYGTVSSELLAGKLAGRIDAAIHTAAFIKPASNGQAAPLAEIDLGSYKLRQLLVHHRDDPCALTPFEPVARLRERIPLLEVQGSSNPRGNACDALTQHGFVGREQQVMKGIANWLLQNILPPPIE